MSDSVSLTHAAERLIARHVDSVGALDLLLLLHGACDHDWSLDELCRSLRCPETWADAHLNGFSAIGLVARVADGRYRYRRGSEYGLATDAIAQACRRDRAAVTRLIFARSPYGRSEFAR